jgi:hypothetical protein
MLVLNLACFTSERAMTRLRGAIGLASYALFQAALLWPSFSMDFTCPEIDNVQLTPDETALIQTIKARDDLANIGTLIVILGPAMDCLTSHPLDCVFSVTTGEWSQIAATPGNLTKIAASINQEDIKLFLLKNGATKNSQFLNCLDKYYGQVKLQ